MALHKDQAEDPFAGWESAYGYPLDEAERKEISHNLSGFFAILNEWREEEIRENENKLKGETDDAQEKSPGE